MPLSLFESAYIRTRSAIGEDDWSCMTGLQHADLICCEMHRLAELGRDSEGWRRRARRRRPRRGGFHRSRRRSPPWCDRRSRRRPARPPCAPGAASASGDRPIRGRDRKTTSTRIRPGHPSRIGTLPRATPTSRSAAANSRCTKAQSGTGRCSVGTFGAGGNSNASRRASSKSSGSGQVRSARRARLKYSLTAAWLSLRLCPMTRCDRCCSHRNRRSSRIFRIDNLSPGISTPCSSAKDRNYPRLKIVSGDPAPSPHPE
jgi:hypothetical protein